MIRWQAMWLAAAVAGIAAGATYTLAQTFNPRSPGVIRGVGDSSATSSFMHRSFGLGALQSSSPAPYNNPLRTSIDRSSYTLRQPSGESSAGGPSPPVMPSRIAGLQFRSYALTPGPDLSLSGGAYGYDPLTSGSPLLKATSSYLRALGGKQNVDLAMRFDITSLITGSDDMFSTYMEEGETAFRSGDFETAMERFKMANTIDPKNPENLLSLAHTSFATSKISYFRAAYYLTRALKFLPELPLAPLQPQGFFASPEQYTERIDWLDKYLQSHPFDNYAFFVAAYFRWFQKDVEGARRALNKARYGEKVSPDLLEAVNTFWDGMKASGKVSGTLEGPATPEPPAVPASQPAPVPAAPAPTESPPAAQAMSMR